MLQSCKVASLQSLRALYIYLINNYGKKKYKLLDIENEIVKYEAGEKNIAKNLYNNLKERLVDIITTVGNEF